MNGTAFEKAAFAILALINSRPKTPTKEELVAILAETFASKDLGGSCRARQKPPLASRKETPRWHMEDAGPIDIIASHDAHDEAYDRLFREIGKAALDK